MSHLVRILDTIKILVGYLILKQRAITDIFITAYYKSRLLSYGIDVYFHHGVSIETPETVSIGDHTHLGEGVHIRGGGQITIGSYCQIANNTIIASGGHPIDGGRYYGRSVFDSISIEDNVWIGSNSIILPGVVIGSNSVVAAGAIVTKSIPPNTVFAGVPARFIKRVPTCVV